MSQGGYRKFLDWKTGLLNKRGLVHPDGRALFLYRISDDEFSSLENMLREAVSHFAQSFGLATIGRLSGFHSLFVLYAAEWWRRRYDGSGFTWDPILMDLGASADDWTPQERSEFITKGLNQWRLEPRRSGALRFLGTVAVQGGLPLNLMASARGGIGRLLKQVLRQASRAPWSDSDLERWVKSLQAQLPKTYRRQEIYTLLADTAAAVLRLKDEAKLESSAEAVSILESRVPGWRDRFPLPIDDAHAQGMIEQLIRDVADTKVQRAEIALPLERVLTDSQADTAGLESRMGLPEHLALDGIARLFGVETADLPRVANLILNAGNTVYEVQLRKLSGRETYRLMSAVWNVPMPDSLAEHVIRLASPDGRVLSAVHPKGEAIDESLPWVFTKEGDELQLFGQGSCSVGRTEVVVALPKTWRWANDNDGIRLSKVDIALMDRVLFDVAGEVNALSEDQVSVKIKTGQAGAEKEHYIWSGERIWLDFASPSIAFRGRPKLLRVDEVGNARRVDGEPLLLGRKASLVDCAYGPVIARYPASGNIRLRTKMIVLPDDAKFELEAESAYSGCVRLKGWGLDHARVLDPEINQSMSRNGRDIRVHLSAKQGVVAPEKVHLELQWPDNPVLVEVTLPFPGRGVRAFDRRGRELGSGSILSTRGVIGTRLSVYQSGGSTGAMLEISGTCGGAYRRYQLTPSVEAGLLSVRLQDYLSDIKELLSADDSLDGCVNIELTMRGKPEFQVKVRKYDAVLEPHGMTVGLQSSFAALGFDDLPNEPFQLLAARLDRPEDEPEVLEPIMSEGVWSGTWAFMSLTRQPGVWLVYPANTSLNSVRPTTWIIEGESQSDSGLKSAVAIPEQDRRIAAYRDRLTQMSNDYGDRDWEYIDRLLHNTAHLPLSSLDIWRAFIREEKAMASLVFRLGNVADDILPRFSQELPFAWECISFSAWLDAARNLRDQCESEFKENWKIVFERHLRRRVEVVQAICPSLVYLLGAVLAAFMDDLKKDLAAITYGIGPAAKDTLFSGADSEVQKLRRAHAEDQWPKQCDEVIDAAEKTDCISRYMTEFMPGYQSAVANIPLLLAAQVATNRTDFWRESPDRIQALKSCKAFAQEWFDEAFNLTFARCLSDGVIKQD